MGGASHADAPPFLLPDAATLVSLAAQPVWLCPWRCGPGMQAARRSARSTSCARILRALFARFGEPAARSGIHPRPARSHPRRMGAPSQGRARPRHPVFPWRRLYRRLAGKPSPPDRPPGGSRRSRRFRRALPPGAGMRLSRRGARRHRCLSRPAGVGHRSLPA